MTIRVALGACAAAAFALSVAACGGGAPPPSDATTAEEAAHTGHAGATRVYFVQPKDGDTIKSMATFEFGSDQLTIAAVPPGDLTEADVRPGMMHYHLGVDTDCLPPGVIIPKADPWIHFGDGKNTIEMQLAPGPHKFVVQIGDDLHRTVEGLCETITVTVVE